MTRLTAKQLTEWRAATLVKQGGRCALCQLPIRPGNAVADHDHSTGQLRGVLHRGCNALLGKVENNAARYGVPNLPAFLHGTVQYLQRPAYQEVYPTHRTEDEKRLARNAKARKARAVKKETA